MVQELSKCENAQDISNIPVPGENGIIGLECSAIFSPGPVLKNAILTLNTKEPFKLIPLMTRTAREFDLAQTKNNRILQGNAFTHSDNLKAWLHGMKVGSITETRYSFTLDDVGISIFATPDAVSCIIIRCGARKYGTKTLNLLPF
jgi:hypothetical protein